MSELSEAVCLEAAGVVQSVPLNVLNYFKLLVSLLGTTVVLAMHKKHGSSWIPHPNGKVLYKTHIYLAFYICFLFVVLYLFQIVRTSMTSDDPCFYVLNARFACIFRLLPIIGIHAQSFNMLAFTCERAVSTLFPGKYETVQRPYFGISLVAFSIVAAICMNVAVYLPIPADVYVTLLTNKNRYNMELYQIAIYIPLTCEIVTVTTFGLNFCLNHRKGLHERTVSHLGNRYQIGENRKVMRALWPCFLVHFSLNVFSYVGIMMYPMVYPQGDVISSSIWIECFGQSQTYSIWMPLIIYCRTSKKNKINVVNVEAATQAYFDQIKDLFENIHSK